MPDFEQPEYFYLHSLLVTPGRINFIFRTGMFKFFSFESHQFPLKATYTERHKTALYRIPLLLHHDGEEYFLMVSAKHEGQIQRREYMIKRAILDLQEIHGWEVRAC